MIVLSKRDTGESRPSTRSGDRQAVCVYLTDGYGEFPEEAPQLPVLWVVVPGGLPSEEIPYGEICRLI